MKKTTGKMIARFFRIQFIAIGYTMIILSMIGLLSFHGWDNPIGLVVNHLKDVVTYTCIFIGGLISLVIAGIISTSIKY